MKPEGRKAKSPQEVSSSQSRSRSQVPRQRRRHIPGREDQIRSDQIRSDRFSFSFFVFSSLPRSYQIKSNRTNGRFRGLRDLQNCLLGYPVQCVQEIFHIPISDHTRCTYRTQSRTHLLTHLSAHLRLTHKPGISSDLAP